jgi:hypothetical protein
MQFAYQLYSQVLSEDKAEDSAGPKLGPLPLVSLKWEIY